MSPAPAHRTSGEAPTGVPERSRPNGHLEGLVLVRKRPTKWVVSRLQRGPGTWPWSVRAFVAAPTHQPNEVHPVSSLRARDLLWMSLVVALVLALVPMGLGAGDAHAQSLEEIRGRLGEVREQQEAIEARLTENQQELEQLLGQIADLEEELAELTAKQERQREEMAEIDAVMSFRIRETFKHGASLDPLSVLLAGEDPAGALAKASTIQHLVGGDQVRTEDLAAARTRANATEEQLEERAEELEAAEARYEEVAAGLQDDLEELEELEASLSEAEREELARIERERKERERRERERREAEAAAADARSSAASSSGGGGGSGSSGGGGGMACPLDQPRHFIDSWGHPRSGGRAHRGTDIMGPHGIPARAITSGTWHHQRVGANAGIWGILRGDNGDHYWYLHLSSHTVSDGARVSAGQQIGTNGSTGNASSSAPHIHFERHPGGGSAVNPYPLLRQVCG